MPYEHITKSEWSRIRPLARECKARLVGMEKNLRSIWFAPQICESVQGKFIASSLLVQSQLQGIPCTSAALCHSCRCIKCCEHALHWVKQMATCRWRHIALGRMSGNRQVIQHWIGETNSEEQYPPEQLRKWKENVSGPWSYAIVTSIGEAEQATASWHLSSCKHSTVFKRKHFKKQDPSSRLEGMTAFCLLN